MTALRTEIFLSSRFDEFSELRSKLRQKINTFKAIPLEAIDFNDGRMSARPPLEECVAAVRHTELMILLVGETYGTPAPEGEGKSFTHLEYEAAIADGSDTVVLPFFVGSSYRSNRIEPAPDKQLAAFQKTVAKNHTYRCLGPAYSVDEAVEEIFQNALKPLMEVRIRSEARWRPILGDGDDELVAEADSGTDEQQLSFEELARLERRHAGPQHDDDDGPDPSNSGPARRAADEQLEIALAAMDLGERFVAMKHLRASVDLYPLNARTNYCLARLLIGTARRPRMREGLNFATRAARLAQEGGLPVLASASLILAARAAGELEENNEGIRLAEQAVEQTGWLARAHLELAARLLTAGRDGDARRSITNAFNLMPQALRFAEGDPIFRRSPMFRTVKDEIRQRLMRLLASLDEQQRILTGDIEPAAPTPGQGGPGLYGMAAAARKAGDRHLQLLRGMADRLLAEREGLAAEERWVKKEHAETEQVLLTLRRRLVALAVAGVVAGVLALLTLASGLAWLGVPLLLAAAVVGAKVGAGWWRKTKAERTRETLSDSQQRIDQQREISQQARNEFQQAVLWFEGHVLTDPLTSPVRRTRLVRPGAIVAIRWDGDRMYLHAEPADCPMGDWSLVPPPLQDGAAPAAPRPNQPFLARVSGDKRADGTRPVIRWGAYFEAAVDGR